MMTTVPPLAATACQVWWAESATADERLLELLDEGERARWSRFRRPQDRALYLVAHAVLRLVLGTHLHLSPPEIRFSTTCRFCGKSHGKPRLDRDGVAIEFSLSHSGGRAVIALTRGHPVGVDVEQVKPGQDRDSLIPAVLTADEQRAIAALPREERGRAFLRYWTRKEALLKATGHGLAIAPSRVTVTAPDQAPALIAWTADAPLDGPVHLFDLDAPASHVAALAILGPRLDVVAHDASALLEAK